MPRKLTASATEGRRQATPLQPVVDCASAPALSGLRLKSPQISFPPEFHLNSKDGGPRRDGAMYSRVNALRHHLRPRDCSALSFLFSNHNKHGVGSGTASRREGRHRWKKSLQPDPCAPTIGPLPESGARLADDYRSRSPPGHRALSESAPGGKRGMSGGSERRVLGCSALLRPARSRILSCGALLAALCTERMG